MSTGRDMHNRLAASSSAEESSLLTTVIIGVAAFAVGALAIVGWKMWPAPNSSPPVAASVSQPTPKFSGNRLGQAELAPLLRTCIKPDMANGMPPDVFYQMITLAGNAAAIGSLINPKEFKNSGELGIFWNMIAECVYQQNSWALCDADNRQLAVTSASASVRNGTLLTASVESQGEAKSRNGQHILALTARAKEQVLDGLRTRLRNGYLIAADFGPVQPPEIKAVLAGTKTIANGCEKQ